MDKSSNLFSYLKAQLPILTVVEEYAHLKKAGNYYKGHCPFHHERTASFTVSPSKGIFYCFGCHTGGDVISFIAKAENYTPLEAARHAIERYSISLPASINWEKDSTKEQRERYFDLCALVAKWCNQKLSNSKSALDYLANRAISPATAATFKLGYFPAAGMKELIEYAQQHSYLAQELIEAKILVESKQLYSPFEERIIFPITDHLGRFCGFGGRVFKPNDERPKYYNSGEHAYFSKGSLLFGLAQSKPALQETDAIFLVEGYTDCVLMSQHGYRNTVATLGTACTHEHLKQISRYVHSIYVLYDGDEAGQKAIIRLTSLCWEFDLTLFVIELPHGEDPASYLAQGNSLKLLKEQAEEIFLFFLRSLGKGFAQKNLQERVRLTKSFIETIIPLDDHLKRDFLLQQASNVFSIPLATLREAYLKNKRKKSIDQPEIKAERRDEDLEKKLFSAILYNISTLNSKQEDLVVQYMPSPYRDILQKFVDLKKQQPITLPLLFDYLSESEKELVSRLIFESESSDNVEIEPLMKRFQRKQWKIIVNNVKLKIEELQEIQQAEKIPSILAEFEELKNRIMF